MSSISTRRCWEARPPMGRTTASTGTTRCGAGVYTTITASRLSLHSLGDGACWLRRLFFCYRHVSTASTDDSDNCGRTALSVEEVVECLISELPDVAHGNLR